jgi:hypothetical protein
MRSNGGRSWWAHLQFTRINIELTILPKKFEDVREAGAVFRAREVYTDRMATIGWTDAARARRPAAGADPRGRSIRGRTATVHQQPADVVRHDPL